VDGTSPAARALAALEALQDSPGITAERLARRLGVTERAVRRYVRVLRDAGIPVESTTGRYGGYRLGRGTRLPPLMLSADEALGLVMAVLERRPGAADGTDPVGSAIGKMVRVLPAALAESVSAVRQVPTGALRGATRVPDPRVTATLVRAAEARRRVRITYRMAEDGTRDRPLEVDPWAVSVWRSRWYLLGWSHASGARRVYRVDRVLDAAVLDAAFTPPAGLDPLAAVEEQMSTGWEHPVEIVVDAPPDDVARWLPRNLGRLEATDDGGTRLVGSTGEPEWFVRHLPAIEAPYRIVSPPGLREAALRLSRRLEAAACADALDDRCRGDQGSEPATGTVTVA
jgi:predicted DNA-binding transcriptional regulator YafY